MVKQDRDSYLSSLSKFCQKIREKGNIRITIKRDRLSNDKPSIKKGFKKEILLKRISELEKDSNLMSNVIFKAKINKKSCSTKVEPNKIISFSNSLLNVFRLNIFQKSTMKIEKKVIAKKHPTPRNEKSKSNLKRKEKNRRNKERRKKRNDIKRNEKKLKQKIKSGAQKKEIKKEMEIEKTN